MARISELIELVRTAQDKFHQKVVAESRLNSPLTQILKTDELALKAMDSVLIGREYIDIAIEEHYRKMLNFLRLAEAKEIDIERTVHAIEELLQTLQNTQSKWFTSEKKMGERRIAAATNYRDSLLASEEKLIMHTEQLIDQDILILEKLKTLNPEHQARNYKESFAIGGLSLFCFTSRFMFNPEFARKIEYCAEQSTHYLTGCQRSAELASQLLSERKWDGEDTLHQIQLEIELATRLYMNSMSKDNTSPLISPMSAIVPDMRLEVITPPVLSFQRLRRNSGK